MNPSSNVLFGVMTVSCGVVALLVSTSKSRSLRHRRLDVLERALAHPQLDPATREELLRALARDQSGGVVGALSRLLCRPQFWSVSWYGAGWLMFVGGSCVLGARALWPSLVPGVDVRDFLPMAITGFAMLTLPLALHELTRRHPASAPNR